MPYNPFPAAWLVVVQELPPQPGTKGSRDTLPYSTRGKSHHSSGSKCNCGGQTHTGSERKSGKSHKAEGSCRQSRCRWEMNGLIGDHQPHLETRGWGSSWVPNTGHYCHIDATSLVKWMFRGAPETWHVH